jgi:hypothetical protein
LWKFGKDGDFEMPIHSIFKEAHAAHINDQGLLMLFNNGSDAKRSRTLAFELDQNEKKAWVALNTWLPSSLYTDRMGSSYLIGDTTLLQCGSKQRTVALTNLNGKILWQLEVQQANALSRTIYFQRNAGTKRCD